MVSEKYIQAAAAVYLYVEFNAETVEITRWYTTVHILFVSDADDKYGAPHSLLQMVSELLKIDNSMKIGIVMTPQNSLAESYSALGCDVYQVPYQPFYTSIPYQKWKLIIKYPLRGIQYYLGRWFGVNLLRKKLNITSIDIIHSNSSREDLGAILAKKFSKPLIWHIREFGDLDYPCYSYRKNYIDLMNRTADRFIAVSDAVCKHWINKGICPDRIRRIYNGVDDVVKVKKNYNSANGQPVQFLIMGSVCDAKGQKQLVEAVRLLPPDTLSGFCIDIVGGGNKKYCKELKKRIEGLGLSKVINMKGYQKDLFKNLSHYDCGIICSNSEGFGRVTVEYMMAGLPVIASNTGANPELVKDHVSGLLYQLNDARDLANKLLMMIENPDMRERMGQYAALYARENYTARKNAEQIYAQYQEILHNT